MGLALQFRGIALASGPEAGYKTRSSGRQPLQGGKRLKLRGLFGAGRPEPIASGGDRLRKGKCSLPTCRATVPFRAWPRAMGPSGSSTVWVSVRVLSFRKRIQGAAVSAERTASAW